MRVPNAQRPPGLRIRLARLGKEGASGPSVASSQGKKGGAAPCLASTPGEGLSRPSALHDEESSFPYDPDQPFAVWKPSARVR